MKLSLKSFVSYMAVKLSLRDPENWREPGARSTSGEAVTPNSALGHATFWACVNLICGTIGSLTCQVTETIDGTTLPATSHPLYNLLRSSPNYDQTGVDFWEYMSASLEIHGSAFAEIKSRETGAITSLIPLRPDLVNVTRRADGTIVYRWYENGVENVATDDKILHIRGPFGNPLGGASTLAICRNSIGNAIATDKAAGAVFQNGMRPSGAIKMEQALTKEQRKETEELLEAKYVGAMNAGRPIILDNGLDYAQISLSPEDAQMLDSRRFSVEEICRIFGVPPHMVGHTENSTSWGSGIDKQTIGFQKFTLRRRLKRIEAALEQQLLTPADRARGIGIKFNIEGLLRADPEGRAKFYESALRNGWMNVNQVCKLENLPPVPGGDVNRVQAQNIPLVEADGLKIGGPDNGE